MYGFQVIFLAFSILLVNSFQVWISNFYYSRRVLKNIIPK